MVKKNWIKYVLNLSLANLILNSLIFFITLDLENDLLLLLLITSGLLNIIFVLVSLWKLWNMKWSDFKKKREKKKRDRERNYN